MLYQIVYSFLSDLYNDIVGSWMMQLQDICGDLARTVFFLEEAAGLDHTVLSAATVKAAFDAMYGICIGLVILKLLYKGWQVYVLWRDGDPEVSPADMLTGAVWAIIVTVAFPLLYEIGIEIAMEIVETVLNALPTHNTSIAMDMILDIFTLDAATSTLVLIVAVIYLVCFLILLFQMLGRSGEMLIWRLGVPIAAVGLVNSDGGAWKNYIQMLFRQIISTMVQYACLILGLRCMTGLSLGSLVLGIILEVTAFAAPKVLSQVMTPRGSGFAQKATSIAMIVRTFVR